MMLVLQFEVHHEIKAKKLSDLVVLQDGGLGIGQVRT